MRGWALGLSASLVAIALASSAAVSPAAADADVDRTWNRGLIFYPKGDRFAFGHIADTVAAAQAANPGKKFPVVVYMHGCSGIDLLSKQTARDYALNGFIVVLPDSFARQDKPQSCDLATHNGNMHRSVISWRQEEARNAIRNARTLPLADPNNVFLVGLSEGAITTATTKGEVVNARIVEGWTCHAGWVEYAGIGATEAEPVLSFTSKDDPWFQNVWARGDCGKFMSKTNGSKSVVFNSSHVLHDQHFVFWHKDVKAEALAFLRAHMK